MIASSLILPIEQPTDIHEIKRALITYDRVYIPSPDDRDLIPPNTYQNAVLASLGFQTFPMGLPTGSVKPLGKTDNYDEVFESLLKDCKPAIDQGSLQILGAPTYTEEITLGGIPVPKDTPNPIFTYLNYRNLVENEKFVKLISEGLKKIDPAQIKDISRLVPTGRENEEQSVNDQKRMPKAEIQFFDKDYIGNDIINKLCHTRLGTLVKYLGYCYLKGLHPFTTDIGYANVISKLEHNFIGTTENIAADTNLLKRQQRIAALHNIILSEYVDPKLFDSLTVDKLLKLRTKAWGKTQENRTALINELNEIAEQAETDKKFERECKNKFDEFWKVAKDYRHEVDKLKIMLLFDANLFFFLKGQEFQLMEKILKAPSIEALLILGGLSAQYAKQHIGAVLDIIKKAEEKRKTTGYAIYSNYKYLIS